jgi:hypothetical protein
MEDIDDGVTKLQEAVLGLLETAGIDVAINDQIIALVAQGEQQKWSEGNKGIPEDQDEYEESGT